MIIAFTEFRHPEIYGVLPGAGARPGDRRGRDVRRVRRLPVVERRAGARSSWATPARSRSAARWPASRCSTRTHAAAADPRGSAADRDALGDRAGHLVPRLPPAGAAHGADPPSLRGRRLVGVHGDRAVLAVRRRSASRSASASSTPTSSGSVSSDAPGARDHAPLRGNSRRAWCGVRLRRDGPDAMTAVMPGLGARFGVARRFAERTTRAYANEPAPPARLRRRCARPSRAQHRRPRDDPLGVVGRRAEQLRLVVVLLQPAARLGARAASSRSSSRRASTTTRGAARARGCSACRVVLLFVVLVPGVGIMVDGSRRWLGYGPLRMQPSELAKLALLVLRRRRARPPRRPPRTTGAQWRPVLVVLGGCSACLVMLEPDLDSTIVLALIAVRAAARRRRAPRSTSPTLGGAGVALVDGARVRGAVPPGAHARVPRPVARHGEHRLPDRAVADRARERRRQRRRPRRGPREVDVPARTRTPTSSSRSSARSSASSAACSCSRCSPASGSSASTSRGTRPTASACCSRPASPRGSSARPRSTSARSSGCCRCRASRCRSCRPAARRS